jgi:hypothetical protein
MRSLQKLENWHGKLLGTGYKDHAASAGKIGIGNKEQILGNIPLYTGP